MTDVGESGENSGESCPAVNEVCAQLSRTFPVRRRINPRVTPSPVLGKPPAKSNLRSPEILAPAHSGPKASIPICDWRKVPANEPPPYEMEVGGVTPGESIL